MTEPSLPRLDTRRERELEAELLERARVWAPEWAGEDAQDFGRALLRVAARLGAKVAERLDRCGDKMRRGLLDWLAVRGQAARPARVPVVFRLGDKAPAVAASAPVRLQAGIGSASVSFETEKDLLVVPGRLELVVAADAGTDALFLQMPGLSSPEPLEPLPTQWRLKSFAAGGAATVQLDPELGLQAEALVELGGQQYRITKVDKDIATLDPPLSAGSEAAGSVVRKVTAFAPWDPATRNRQRHALYLGHATLLDIEAKAVIDVLGAEALGVAVAWAYWGKLGDADVEGWQPMQADPQPAPGGGVRLRKPRGAMVPRDIGNVKGMRWIAATAAQVPGEQPALAADSLSLRINAGELPPCPDPAGCPTLKALGFANTTPLVLDNTFPPLGRTPRLFDTFYLACPEAFSKPGALVQLCFELADATTNGYAVVQDGSLAGQRLAGVGQDRALHLFAFDAASGAMARLPDRASLQPPVPGLGGTTTGAAAVALDPPPPWRPPVWTDGNDFWVAVVAGTHVWAWRESAADGRGSGWVDLGSLPATAPREPVEGLVYLQGASAASPVLVALQGGQLFVRRQEGWSLVKLREVPSAMAMAGGSAGNGPTEPITLRAIAPVLGPDLRAPLVSSPYETLVGIDAKGALYAIKLVDYPDHQEAEYSHVELKPNGAEPPVLLTPQIRPVALRHDDGSLSVISVREGARLPGDPVTKPIRAVELVARLPDGKVEVSKPELPMVTQLLGYWLESALDVDKRLTCVATVLKDDGAPGLLSWVPGHPDEVARQPFVYDMTGVAGAALGAPARVGAWLVVSGEKAQAHVAPFKPVQRVMLSAQVQSGIVLPAAGKPRLKADDVVIVGIADARQRLTVTSHRANFRDQSLDLYAIDPPLDAGPVTREARVYRVSGAGKTGEAKGEKLLQLADKDNVVEGSTVFVRQPPGDGSSTTTTTPVVADQGEEYEVQEVVTSEEGKRVAKLDRNLHVPAGRKPTYWTVARNEARPAPYVELSPVMPHGRCPAAYIDKEGGILVFEDANPLRQTALVAAYDGNNATLLVMGEHWRKAPPEDKPQMFMVEATVGGWNSRMAPSESNPELSWEYWNGGWSRLVLERDDTLNLRNTGAVQFYIPRDIAATDWAGKTERWVRARLIGGDYGGAAVTVEVEDLGKGKTRQTVTPASDSLRAPLVTKLCIAYALSDAVLPTHVLCEDSGSIRDQSDANRTVHAIVEAFVPLGLMLRRLGAGGVVPAPASAPGPRDDGCGDGCGTTAARARNADDSAAAALAPGGRALFLGLSQAVAGQPVRLLFVVDREADHARLAPLRVEALVGERFVPLVTEDETRALGETGLLTLSLEQPPTLHELFGRPLAWLRVAPAPAADGAPDWLPSLQGVYLNAAWASATETLTLELLGSSAGEPGLALRLARPPVLAGTLELRVRELLDTEERQALLARDLRAVKTVPDMPGDWVLWEQVIDPGDEGPGRRVYALDEGSGEVRFGDGLHGAIPPAGRDAIVAFRYQRTEPPDAAAPEDVPANRLQARTALNLVTPVGGVEAVFSALNAAGGAPPESDARVLRFGASRLRHRGRALTARDFEDIALASSPDLVQARALPQGHRLRLVVVMRGAQPAPDAPQRRELCRLLLEAAPAGFSAQALDIAGPAVRRLRIRLLLRVPDLEAAGRVGQGAAQRLRGYFAAGGGAAGDGWPLGASPREDDVALALRELPELQAIEDVVLAEVREDGSEQPWPAALRPDELAWLDEDALRLRFRAEGEAP